MYKNLLNKNKTIIILITIIGFIINLPLFTKNILTADIILNTTYYNAYSWELSLGRFGLFLLGILKSYVVIPHLELLLSLILIGFITILLIDLFDIKNKYLKLLIGWILVISPSVFTTLLFHYCSFAYTLSFFLSIFSIHILWKGKNKKTKYLISGISQVLALSIYQAYIQVTVTLFLFLILKKLLEKNLDYKELLKNFITILLSLISYFILMKLSIALLNIDMSSYSGANQFGIKNILNIPQEILTTYITFFQYFRGNQILNNTYLYNHILNFLILILLLGIIIYKSIKKKLKVKDYLVLFTIILILPISMNLILLIIPDTKMQLLMSSSYILLFIFFIYLIKDLKKTKYIGIILLLILSRNFIIEQYSTTKTLEITYNKTYQIASNILDHINQYNYKDKIMITGNLENNDYYNNNNKNELNNLKKLNYGFISNKSLFWEEYTNIKNGWLRFYYEHFGVDLNFVSEEEYNTILQKEEFKEMTTYPNKNSIKKIDNIIVIKIS